MNCFKYCKTTYGIFKKYLRFLFLNYFCIAFIVTIYFLPVVCKASLLNDSTEIHKLTVYVISPPCEINWESPATLIHSIRKSYFKKIFHPKSHFVGHMAFLLESPLLSKPLYVGIVPKSHKQMRRKVFHDKMGLGALGYGFEAAMENEEFLKDDIRYNKKENRLLFVEYKISRQAVQNILNFLSDFSKKFNDKYAPNNFYGGAFLPLYEYEGSGCSALCVSAMQLSNIPSEQADAWLVKRKIPMTLIGGELNSGKKIKIHDIRVQKKWYDGDGKEDIDYIDFEIYDPTLAARWIKNKIAQNPNGYTISADSTGICFDYSHAEINPNNVHHKKREKLSFFIKNYYQKAGIPYKGE